MANRVRIDGLRELEAALANLPKATGKNVLRRVLKKAAEPVEAAAASAAPVRTGVLKGNVVSSFHLNANQKKAQRQSGDKASVEIHVGVRAGKTASGAAAFAQIAGVQTEFGNIHQQAQPWLRPAWDANKEGALQMIGDDLGTEIEKAAARLARKAARLAAKG